MGGIVSGMVQSTATDFGTDYAMEKYEEFMGTKFQPVKDPYYVEMSDGKRVRRRLPAYCTKQETKTWKRLQNRAWYDDRCFLGCGYLWIDWGIGWATMLSLIPVIGPVLMYLVHSSTIEYARKRYELPESLVLKMHGNIMFDLLISLPPVIGTLFAWMSQCSTRNAAMVYNYVCKASWAREQAQREQGIHPQGPSEHTAPLPGQGAGPAAATTKTGLN
ncbi:hypothetical protein KLU848_1412 [Kluyveromyces marxianus]|nr:hypothetical protein C6P43_003679 [Kluyveromyces marxianus]KAG0680138.1 hypothetical protein C6P41_000310 [Kluyveromyces marxianus]